jgi:hypothetical protein
VKRAALAAAVVGALACRLPPPGAVPAVGAPAPDFELGAADGRRVRLSEVLERGSVLLVFYRGHW